MDSAASGSLATRPPAGRFAPSPTGPLHFGSLVAAVASYADARHAQGTWRLRIDDVDVTRARDDAGQRIVATLAELGFRADGEIVRQTARVARYDAAFAALKRDGAVYPCTCTRASMRDWPIGAAGEPVHPPACQPVRHDAATARTAWRARVDASVVGFEDRVQGHVEQVLAREVGDFVVRRSDGLYAYQLAIVVDDADDAITDVVRGADLVASTPRQILLQRLLGLPTPRYLHVPVALAPNGDKLSKQTDARSIEGGGVAALMAAWRFLGQLAPADTPPSTAAFWQHALAHWDPARIARVPALPCPPGYG